MGISKHITASLAATGASLKSMAKLCLQARPVGKALKKAAKNPERPIYILANGPSLNASIKEGMATFEKGPAMVVNFAANTPEFLAIKPAYYVLADPLFFDGHGLHNVESLWHNLARASWPLTLLVPAAMRGKAREMVKDNPNVSVTAFNPIGVEGWQWLESMAYGRAWGMPRPRNVLVPAIMAAAAMGYKEIYLFGADHSWMQTISVDEDNHVVSVQPHFYKDDAKERQRVDTTYAAIPLHQVVESFAIAFRSYHRLQRWAKRKGINIYNSTPGSFIDAFPRKKPWPAS